MSRDPVGRLEVADGVGALDAAHSALEAGAPDEALALARRAVELLTAESGPSHPDTANAHLAVALAHERAGRFGPAREVAAVAASILDGYPESGVPAVAILRVQAQVAVGNLDRVLGDLDAARERLNRVMVTAEAELGPGHPEAARIFNVLGIVGKFSARFDEAEHAYLRALACHEASGDCLAMASVLHNLGGLEHERGRPEPGIRWAERGLALRRSVRAAEHPDVAADLGALGALYQSAGRLDDAERAYRQAFVIFAAALGPDHYEVAVVSGNLAQLLASQGKPAVAEQHYRFALVGKAAALGEDHPDLAVTLHNLGVLLVDNGQSVEGRDLLRRAEALISARLPDDHPRVVAVRQTLATL